MATVAGQGSNITLTAAGAVSISYKTLVSAPQSLPESIGRCFARR